MNELGWKGNYERPLSLWIYEVNSGLSILAAIATFLALLSCFRKTCPLLKVGFGMLMFGSMLNSQNVTVGGRLGEQFGVFGAWALKIGTIHIFTVFMAMYFRTGRFAIMEGAHVGLRDLLALPGNLWFNRKHISEYELTHGRVVKSDADAIKPLLKKADSGGKLGDTEINTLKLAASGELKIVKIKPRG